MLNWNAALTHAGLICSNDLLKNRDGNSKIYSIYSIIVDFARGFCLH
jgi:hypothetical protein